MIGLKNAWHASTLISVKMTMIHYIAGVERDVSMNKLSTEEAIKILEDMKADIPVPKAAVTQIRRNIALDMAVDVLSNCLKISNSWVPCSERLPVGSEIVLLTIPEHTDSYGEYHHSSVVCGHYVGGKNEGWGISDGSTFGYGLLSKVYEAEPIAWSPMPKPYNPESEE